LKAVFSVGSAIRLYNKDPRPAERIIDRELWADSRELSSVREAEKRWHYRWVDNWESLVAEHSLDRKDLNTGSWRISTVRSHCQGMAVGRHSRLEKAQQVL
jgi:hypothetical protein